ncbi:PaaI family thioesterase [Sinirhodobacter populi]|uniref:PaaI family thioesterase n=1 Tax=Paenirhodobacter populi TaxID=2306993 RepID=A0A443KG79_9RHOB|nr:PaaI family thioesterase [Sinirhodobacter populi]RWR31750.1 PaaI family thioesterase [Sinirhodobacter populi]
MSEQIFAETSADFPPRSVVRSMPGLDYLRKVMAGEVPAMTIAQQLNFRLTHVEKGMVEVTGTPEHSQTNTFGGVHGGWYGVILDSCLTAAVISALERGQFQTTLEYKVNMVKAIPVGTTVIGTGRLEHLGRSTGIARGEIRGAEDGTLYALGTATCFIMGEPG